MTYVATENGGSSAAAGESKGIVVAACGTFGLTQSCLGYRIDMAREMAIALDSKELYCVRSLSAKDANTIERAHEAAQGNHPVKTL